ncbi:MAG: DNA-directed RNA polymerase subunit H [Candidatus Aenigmarchaeota archaeon]|nr:DNA-directed RNA polymerase subunit H [Candidatus Aenigmarchaeota archaeon]
MKEEIKITSHLFVPKHEILSPDEIKHILDAYKISINQLPRITEDDVVVKEIGANVGDVLKITRPSPTAGVSYYYRLVVREQL